MHFSVGHTAWEPEGPKGRRQAGKNGQKPGWPQGGEEGLGCIWTGVTVLPRIDVNDVDGTIVKNLKISGKEECKIFTREM